MHVILGHSQYNATINFSGYLFLVCSSLTLCPWLLPTTSVLALGTHLRLNNIQKVGTPLCTDSSVHRQLSCFHLLVWLALLFCNHIYIQVPVSVYTPLFTSFGHTPGHKVASLDGIPVYSFMVAHQNVFHSGHAMSHSPTNYRSSKLYILLTCAFLLSLPSTSGCRGASHWGFDFLSCAYWAEQSRVTFVDCRSIYSADSRAQWQYSKHS